MLALGFSHPLSRDWLLRFGVAKEQSPIPDATRSVRLPSDDRTIYGVGAKWIYSQALSFDMAYAYVKQRSTNVDLTNGQLHYSANYETSLSNLRLQANWTF